MQETATALKNKPAWTDLGSSDPKASQEFYSKVLGWQMDVSDDPQYGGYATAKSGGENVAGIGGLQMEGQPTVWSLYIGTDDLEGLTRKITDAGGTVVAPPLEIPNQGWMAVYQDPAGAYISAWQAGGMSGFGSESKVKNGYSWAEVNARGVDKVIPFYEEVFGWTTRTSPMGEGQLPYNEFQLEGKSVAGAWEMNPMVPAEVPAYWLVYFEVDDVDASFKKAIDAGAKELAAPQDYPGGRFTILTDPQGASFGLLKSGGQQPNA